MSTHEIEAKCRELRQLQALIDEAEAEMDIIKDEIKAYMGDVEEIRAGEYQVTWKTITSARLDTAAIRRLLPDIAQQFTKPTTTRRFCIA